MERGSRRRAPCDATHCPTCLRLLAGVRYRLPMDERMSSTAGAPAGIDARRWSVRACDWIFPGWASLRSSALAPASGAKASKANGQARGG